MRRWLVGLLCVAAGASGLLAQGQRPGAPPPAQNAQPATGTGILLGQVVDGSTGQPLDGATVTVSGPAFGRGRAGTAPAVQTTMAVPAVGATGLPQGTTPLAAANGLRELTDDQGRFVFHDLPAGAVSLSANAPDYVPGSFGQTRPNGPSRPLSLPAAARMGDIKIRLWKYAVITGSVTDDLGEPAVGVTVRALRKTTAGGQPQLAPTGSVTTDDRGEFRLASLVPGDYLVAIPETLVTMPVATVQSTMDSVLAGRGGAMLDFVASGGPMPNPGGTRVGDNFLQISGEVRPLPPPVANGHLGAYLTQYFPGASLPAQAAVLSLRSGDEKGGINLQLRVAPTATLRGSVAAPDGPVANAPVRLTLSAVDEAAIATGFDTATTLTRADGSFTLLAVPPGQYTLRVQKLPRPNIPAGVASNAFTSAMLGSAVSDPGQPTVPLYGQATVALGSTDVALGTIALREGARLSGRLEFVGSMTPPRSQQLQAMTVALTPADGRTLPAGRGFAAGPAPGPVGVDANGQFKTIGYPPGRYTVTLTGPVPQGWTLTSALFNGRDVLTTPLDIALADLDGAVLTFSDKVTQVSGTVRGVTPTDTAVVLIFPSDYKTWIADGMSPRRYRQTPTSVTGAFSMANLLAGDYEVVALNDADVPDNTDPVFFDAMARQSTHVALTDGDKKAVDLAIVRIK